MCFLWLFTGGIVKLNNKSEKLCQHFPKCNFCECLLCHCKWLTTRGVKFLVISTGKIKLSFRSNQVKKFHQTCKTYRMWISKIQCISFMCSMLEIDGCFTYISCNPVLRPLIDYWHKVLTVNRRSSHCWSSIPPRSTQKLLSQNDCFLAQCPTVYSLIHWWSLCVLIILLYYHSYIIIFVILLDVGETYTDSI